MSDKYRPCKKGESPKSRKSGIRGSAKKDIASGRLRFNKKGGFWEKRIEKDEKR